MLLLGGASEAGQCAILLASLGVDAIYSYAGRTRAPKAQPLPMRHGGFGGVEGLAAFLRAEAITHVIDATHPFAAQMGAHAIEACAATGVALCAVERPPWRAQPGDRWIDVADVAAAVAALPEAPARVFLAIGRQNIKAFRAKPQHVYLMRVVEPPPSDDRPPDHVLIEARGPFALDDERALLRRHAISHVVAKNSGGEAAAAKLVAARERGASVIMIARPFIPARPVVHDPQLVVNWLLHDAKRGA